MGRLQLRPLLVRRKQNPSRPQHRNGQRASGGCPADLRRAGAEPDHAAGVEGRAAVEFAFRTVQFTHRLHFVRRPGETVGFADGRGHPRRGQGRGLSGCAKLHP